MSDRTLRAGDKCQLCDLAIGDRFETAGGYFCALKSRHSSYVKSECGQTFPALTTVTFRCHAPSKFDPRILKGSELLVGDSVLYAESPEVKANYAADLNQSGPFRVQGVTSVVLLSVPGSCGDDFRGTLSGNFELLSRAEPTLPRTGTRADLVPGMRYKCVYPLRHEHDEFVFVAQRGPCFVFRELGVSQERTCYPDLNEQVVMLGMCEIFGVDPAAGPDQAVEVTTVNGKVTEAKVIATRPNCQDCLKPHTFTAGHGVLVELTLKGEWLCTDCSGARRPLKPRPEPPQARKLPPSVAYHLNDAGGSEGPGWSE